MLHFPSSEIGPFGRRQRHARGHRIPVSIVRGSVASRDDGPIVVTDFGADEVMPPGTGCRCCTVRGELQTTLRRLLLERAQGRDLNRVVIQSDEDLLPILRTFVTEHALAAEFYVEDFPSADIGADEPGVCRFELTEKTPLSWKAFSRFIAALTALRGRDLLYVTGALNIDGGRGPVMVQIMQHLAHRPVELQAWPDGNRISRLAFITRNVEEKMVRGLFDSVRAFA